MNKHIWKTGCVFSLYGLILLGALLLSGCRQPGGSAADSIPDVENTGGSIRMILSYPAAEKTASVKAGLYTEEETGIADSEVMIVPTDGTDSRQDVCSVTYERAGIPEGTYVVRFVFYADSEAVQEVARYQDIVQIVSGHVSVQTRELDTIYSLYRITYHLSGGIWADGYVVPATYSSGKAVSLPLSVAVSRTGYVFAGWYTTETCVDGYNISGWAAGEKSGDVEVWAGWSAGPAAVTLTFELEGGILPSLSESSITGICGDPLVVPNPVRTGYRFAGWNPPLPNVFPTTDTTYVASWASAGPAAVTGLRAGYDCAEQKFGILWKNPVGVTIQEIHIVWRTAAESAEQEETLSADSSSWYLENIPADGNRYSFGVSIVDTAGAESSLCTVETAADRYHIGQIIYRSSGGMFSGVVSDTAAGIIFEAVNDGSDYKMVSLRDVSITMLAWSENGDYYYRSDTNSLEDGRINTAAAEAYCTENNLSFNRNTFSAMYYCKYYNVSPSGGLLSQSSGWYLPAVNELNMIYAQKSVIESAVQTGSVTGDLFRPEIYWSSTQTAGARISAQAVCFTDGKVSIDAYRTGRHCVRAIYTSVQ